MPPTDYSWSSASPAESPAQANPPHSEFQRLGLVGHDFIQCLYVAAHGVLHGPHILQDDVGRQHLGIYKAGLEEGTPQQDFRKDKMSDKRNLVLR